MRTFDPTPLWRSTVGFDRLFNLIDETARWAGDDTGGDRARDQSDDDPRQPRARLEVDVGDQKSVSFQGALTPSIS